jgi:Flp pilus assembly CpaE family ATPase
VLNRYTPVTGLKRDDVKTALGVEPFASLSNDYEVMQAALLDGKPAPPGSRFGVSVAALCAQLSDQPKVAAAKTEISWITSLFRR